TPRDSNWSWRTPAALIAVATLTVTIIIAAVAYYPSADSADSTRKQTDIAASEASRLPKLKVARTAAYIDGDLKGVSDDGQTKIGGLRGPLIDITFENRANGPALIIKATLKFREMGEIAACLDGGSGGVLGVSANYDFPVPNPLPEMPFHVEKEISFEVGANEYDRLTLTTGPAASLGTPWFSIVDVVIEHDGGKKMQIGPFALIDTGMDQRFHPKPHDGWVVDVDDPSCLSEVSEITERLLGTPKVTASKELKSLKVALGAHN
ncbi:hypothetical protein, partial [Streptomyces bacillaris]|uniref:hypothetical protein n=1 Tax=Streptomyces bacillaris TaxID=68179 RepID=UPI0036F8C618